jgi:hypothetical protein
MNWKEFIDMHMDVAVATDFFTTEVWTWCGLVTYVHIAGVTPHPDKRWMRQTAHNVTMAEWRSCRQDSS